MTEFPPPSPVPPVDPEKVACQRHLAISLFRLSGAFIVMFGFLAIMQRFSWIHGNKAKAFGGILVVVGLFQFVFVPRLMLALFRRTKP
jgi:drug/metabolite transporter superfamily protein YnfA